MTEILVNSNKLICEKQTYTIFEDKICINDFINIKASILPNEFRFGILNIKTINNTNNFKTKKQHIIFNIDCSGSMSDICDDGKSKMTHIIHTITNMILYLVEQVELSVFITVFTFDGNTYSIIENELITKDNHITLIDKIRKIRPLNMTNIEKAFHNFKEYLQKIKKENLDNDDITITHIFMTDGEANEGIINPQELSQILKDISVTSIFIGFGLDHNAYLLKLFSSVGKNKYYFIDALEKAGYVYGEILHSIIYKILQNITIFVKNGFIYDWKRNEWTQNMIIDDFVTDINKVFHLLTENPSKCQVIMKATNYYTNETFEIIIIEKDGENDCNFTKYKYRQKTQELLFEVNNYNFNQDVNENVNFDRRFNEKQVNIKKKMNNLLKEMKNYYYDGRSNGQLLDEQDKKFMKLLCDDIYLCLQTFDTKYGAMFSCSRQASQGEQRSYSATCTPDLKNNYVGFVKRTNTIGTPRYRTLDEYDDYIEPKQNESVQEGLEEEEEKEEVYKKDTSINSVLLNNIFSSNLNEDNNNGDNNNEDTNIDEEYNVSDQINNTYSNISILNIMKNCSATIDNFNLFK
jgi:hypothetical protein